MSAPSDRHGRTSPLHDSNNGSNNGSSSSRHGIRLVPYTPPRLDPEERAPSQASARPEVGEDAGSQPSTGNYDIQTIRSVGHWRRSSEPIEAKLDESHATPGSALPSPTAAGFSLARPGDERVSGMKPLVSPSGFGQGGPTTSRRRSPSEVATNIKTFNASALRASRSAESPSPSQRQARSLSRRRNIIVLQPDKTFAIVPRNDDRDSGVSASQTPAQTPTQTPLHTPSVSSPPPSHSSVRSSTHERPSIDLWTDSRADTPMTGVSTVVPDQSFTVRGSPTPSHASSTTVRLGEDPTTSSPWNYRMFGGLRKVPSTPDHSKGKQLAEPETPLPPLSPVPETTSSKEEAETPTNARKPSFTSIVSEVTINTVSESTNYKVYGPGSVGQESRDSLVFNSASPANWEILGDATPSPVPAFALTSPPSPIPEFSLESSPPETVDGNESENYVVHGAGSVTISPSSSLVTVSRKPRPSYSQESLTVAPLRPGKRRSNENFGYYKQRSRESLRSRANSLKTVSSIIGSQGPSQSLLTVAPVVINLAPLTARVARGGGSGSSGSSSSSDNFPWLPTPTPGSSARPTSPSGRTHGSSRSLGSLHIPALQNRTHTSTRSVGSITALPMIQAHPHQWSSQLSTVLSESEESDPVPTRSVSPLSDSSGGHRRGTSWMSRHSRQMQSISSSLAQADENVYTTSGSESYPTSSSRSGPSQMRTVRNYDEHGDGIADLDHQPSMSGLSSMFANSGGSSRPTHSRGSSRASRTRANSLTSSIPAWARVYYGSGERRWLGRSPSFLTISESGSRPGSSGLFPDDESPIDDQFPPAIFSPRKRAREVDQSGNRPYSDQADVDVEQGYPGQSSQPYGVFRTLREKTSSIWSPHLRQDRRASRFSMWDPPSVTWSADTGIMGKRNAQIVLFSIGFLLPFAWMIAAVLPLPELYNLDAEEVNKGKRPETESRFQPRLIDEKRHDSARWWRNLNRIMSLVGLLIIGAVVALAVIGVRQGWGHEMD